MTRSAQLYSSILEHSCRAYCDMPLESELYAVADEVRDNVDGVNYP
jgi:hypothetical protein